MQCSTGLCMTYLYEKLHSRVLTSILLMFLGPLAMRHCLHACRAPLLKHHQHSKAWCKEGYGDVLLQLRLVDTEGVFRLGRNKF